MSELARSVPCVSVCVPTYRGAGYLGKTIESVLAQRFTDYELLILDDNSPDDTRSVVARYSDPRIRYIKNPDNLGPEGNWNRCLQEASGRYFKLLPQDDLLYPDTLQRQVAILEGDKEQRISLVFGARNITGSDDSVITKRGYSGTRGGVVRSAELVRRCVRFGTNLIGEPGGVLMRKRLADQIGAFDGSLGYIIDLDYWVRLLAHGDAYYLESPVSSFRVSNGSWSVAIGGRQSVEYRRFIAKLRAQPEWNIGVWDSVSGNIMARLNNLMRLAFYRFVLPN